ncbi:MAG: hypothetical protein WKF73_07500 [Nocardioidaceae bacterium]
MTGTGVIAGGWDRRRLLLGLVAVVTGAVTLLVGFGLAIYFGITSSSSSDTTATTWMSGVVDGDLQVPDRGPGRRDQIAAVPMLAVTPADSRPTQPAATAAPPISIPASTEVGPAAVPTGFPHTPEGAVGQLAAIEITVLQAMSIAHTGEVYEQWAMSGGDVASWEMTQNVQAFLGAAEMGDHKDITTTVMAKPVAALVKGVGGPDWVVACVLLDIRATITAEARMGYGHCSRMQWVGERWMIAPGVPPAKAPSTWPGSELSIKAGWQSWVSEGRD